MFSRTQTYKIVLWTVEFSFAIIPFCSYEGTSFFFSIVEARPGIIPLQDFRTAAVTA
jgi:hypothetical protein